MGLRNKKSGKSEKGGASVPSFSRQPDSMNRTVVRKSPFSEEDLLRVLISDRRRRPDDPGMTTEEIAKTMEVSLAQAGRLLRQAVKQGNVVCNGRRIATTIHGKAYLVPVYVPAPALGLRGRPSREIPHSR